MDGKDCRVHRDVERVLKEFHEAGKPIGCVADPLLLPPGGFPWPHVLRILVWPPAWFPCPGSPHVQVVTGRI